ncbi:MAG: hypothetical protein IT208_01595 [Chthonomonadales bacterium]|nr:hypothetical protein [Chthonomonadales bacterium]
MPPLAALGAIALAGLLAGQAATKDPDQRLERTCFQTGAPYADRLNLRADVAIVYGIDAGMPGRIATWRERGYRIHVMTGVSWGEYQDYLYGRFDGANHEDEAQTERSGARISHGGDVYYMCPGPAYGRFLCVGVQRALDAGADAIHLEEPEFWVRGGWSEGFKREWRARYNEDWVPPDSSPDAQWRASSLKYFLYRRALQQVFDYVQRYNRRTGRQVRCYVPTHSLLNYAHWRIVSPESSLAQLDGCDGYIAQVWTGTARTPNMFRGAVRERTFETAFLEYGAMQNLVRATGRRVWYLNDPVEDNPNHDWGDYRRNWESTLVASMLQPEVWRYEVMPWPERVWRGQYPSAEDRARRVPIPPTYATELQAVINALAQANQRPVRWDCGTQGIGVIVSDSLMFQRAGPGASDGHMSHFYGLALPLLMRGVPVQPVQLENVGASGYLRGLRALVLTYQGMKPLTPDVHDRLAAWVRAGGVLVVWDDDSDAFNAVREWWNTDLNRFDTPRKHLFERLGLGAGRGPGTYRVGRGTVVFVAEDPVALARAADGGQRLIDELRGALEPRGVAWRETGHLLLRRGALLAAAGLAESPRAGALLHGRFVNLFDANLPVLTRVELTPRSRYLLVDLDALAESGPRLVAAACRALPTRSPADELSCIVEGVADTRAVVLVRFPRAPGRVELDGQPVTDTRYDAANRLLWVRFPNEARARTLRVFP